MVWLALKKTAITHPTKKATEVYLYDGLTAISSNSAHAFDLRRWLQPLHRFMPAGFYYKTFINRYFWRLIEGKLRAFSGFSKPPTVQDSEVYDHCHHHCEVLIIGGGVAGMAAAVKLLQDNQQLRLILLDDRARLGGELLSDMVSDQQALDWHQEYEKKLRQYAQSGHLTLLQHTTAFGWHDQNYIVALEKLNDHLPLEKRAGARQILHKIRAKQVILASGSHERPMLFANNDLVHVMLAQSVRRYLNEFAAIGGKNIVILRQQRQHLSSRQRPKPTQYHNNRC